MSDNQEKEPHSRNYKLHAFITFQAVLFALIFYAFFGNPFAQIHEGMLDLNLQNTNPSSLSSEIKTRDKGMQFDH